MVLDCVFGLEESFINGKASKSSSLALSDHDSEFELGNEVSRLFNEDGEGDEKFVFQALLNTDSGGNGVFEGVKAEAERRISVKNFVEELSALLNLKVVGSVECSLVDSASQITLLRLSLSTADEDIKSEDIVNCKLLSIDSLLEGLFVDDNLVAVNKMLLELMGKDALKWGNLIGITNLLNNFSNLIVEVAWLKKPQSGLSSLIGSQDDIGLLAGHGSVLIGLNHDSMGNKGSKTVNVSSEFDLDEISFLDGGGIFEERCIVATNLID